MHTARVIDHDDDVEEGDLDEINGNIRCELPAAAQCLDCAGFDYPLRDSVDVDRTLGSDKGLKALLESATFGENDPCLPLTSWTHL